MENQLREVDPHGWGGAPGEPLNSHIHSFLFRSQSPAWHGLCERAGWGPLLIPWILASTHPSGERTRQAGVQLGVKQRISH